MSINKQNINIIKNNSPKFCDILSIPSNPEDLFTLLYPIGEGAGYSGGITTSSVDGIKVSEILRSKYRKS